MNLKCSGTMPKRSLDAHERSTQRLKVSTDLTSEEVDYLQVSLINLLNITRDLNVYVFVRVCVSRNKCHLLSVPTLSFSI